MYERGLLQCYLSEFTLVKQGILTTRHAEPSVTRWMLNHCQHHMLLQWPAAWCGIQQILSKQERNLQGSDSISSILYTTRRLVELRCQQGSLSALEKKVIWRACHDY